MPGLFDGVISVILPGILTPFSARKIIPPVPICRYVVAPNRRKSNARVERQVVLQFFDASDRLQVRVLDVETSHPCDLPDPSKRNFDLFAKSEAGKICFRW